MTDETLEAWLKLQIKDAENCVEMYRSYRQGDRPDAMAALARLQAFEDVHKKITELWGMSSK